MACVALPLHPGAVSPHPVRVRASQLSLPPGWAPSFFTVSHAVGKQSSAFLPRLRHSQILSLLGFFPLLDPYLPPRNPHLHQSMLLACPICNVCILQTTAAMASCQWLQGQQTDQSGEPLAILWSYLHSLAGHPSPPHCHHQDPFPSSCIRLKN